MGSYEINPLTYGIKYTNFFYSLYWYFLFEREKPLGLGGYFFFFEENFFFHNILFRRCRYSSSNGTFSSIYYFDSILKMYLISLPSQKKIFLPELTYGYVGRNTNIL